MQPQKFSNSEACARTRAPTEHALNRSIFQDVCSRVGSTLLKVHGDIYEALSDKTLSDFEHKAIRSSGPRKASAAMYVTPATTAQRSKAKGEAEPALFDFDLDYFDMELLSLDC